MKLENQVCNLKLSKQLKDLGVKQESLFWWWEKVLGSGHPSTPYKQTNEYSLKCAKSFHWSTHDIITYGTHPFNNSYSAFTVAELGKAIAKNAKGWETIKGVTIGGDLYMCFYDGREEFGYFYGKTEAICRAKMLIYLIENGLRGEE